MKEEEQEAGVVAVMNVVVAVLALAMVGVVQE